MEIDSLFKNILEHDLIAELRNKANRLEIDEGVTILKIGEVIRGVPIVLSGTIKVVRLDDDGHELLLYYVNPGETCAMTLTSYLQRSESEIKAVTDDKVELLIVPLPVADEWYYAYPGWRVFVMRTIRERFKELLRAIDQVAFQKLDDRLISYLRERSKMSGSPLINLSHEQIAADLATSRVVISRLLKKLELQKKLILYRNQIRIMREL